MEAKEGVKIDRLEFSFDIPEGAFPTFQSLDEATCYFDRPVERGPKPFYYMMRIDRDILLFFSDRRGKPRIPCGKVVFGSDTSNKVSIVSVISRLKPLLPDWVQLRRMSRVDICSDKFIPFKEFCNNVAPLGFDEGVFCASEFQAVYKKSGKPGTFQFGNGDTVIRIYNKQDEQGTEFAWSRAEMQFRGDIIRHTGNVPTDSSCLDSILQLVAHGLHFFRPCEKFFPTNSTESVVSSYWLSLFSQLSDPGRLRRNVYYV